MRSENIKSKIIKCRVLLILYMTLAVGLFGMNQTEYGALVNQHSFSFLKMTKEYILQEIEEYQTTQVQNEQAVVQVMAEEEPEEVEASQEEEAAQPLGTIHIQTAHLNVRETPNGTILGTVSMGEEHDYYEEKNGWFRIAYKDMEGYVYGRYGDIYDAEGNLIQPANIPQPEPAPEPVPVQAVEESVVEPVQEQPVAEPIPEPVQQKDPAQMNTTELCEWVLSQIITPDMDDFAKVCAVNQYLCDTITYDINYYTTRDALLQGRARCQGYTNAFKNLMNTLGIPTDYVRGYAGGVTSSTHAWNRVLIGGTYYYVDVTWNDTCGNNRYLLLDEATFNQGRTVISYNPKSE